MGVEALSRVWRAWGGCRGPGKGEKGLGQV